MNFVSSIQNANAYGFMASKSLCFGISWNFLLFFKDGWYVHDEDITLFEGGTWSRSSWQMPTPITGVWGLTQVFKVCDTCRYVVTLCVCRILSLYHHMILCLHVCGISLALSNDVTFKQEWHDTINSGLVCTTQKSCPSAHQLCKVFNIHHFMLVYLFQWLKEYAFSKSLSLCCTRVRLSDDEGVRPEHTCFTASGSSGS